MVLPGSNEEAKSIKGSPKQWGRAAIGPGLGRSDQMGLGYL